MHGSPGIVEGKCRWRHGIKRGKTIAEMTISDFLHRKQHEGLISSPCNSEPDLGNALCHDTRCCITQTRRSLMQKWSSAAHTSSEGQKKTQISKAVHGVLWILAMSSLYPPHSVVFPWYSTRNAFDLKTRGCCQMTVNIKWKEPWDATSCPATMWSFNRSRTEKAMDLSAESHGSSAGVFS